MVQALLLAVLLNPSPGPVAQAPPQELDPDALFLEARQAAFDGRREQARALCRRILEKYPEYHDVRILLGRVLAWDEEYDAARTQLSLVLARSPRHLDARLALTDVELWSDRPEQALLHAQEGLKQNPQERGLIYRKAVALRDLGRHQEAYQTVDDLLRSDPRCARPPVQDQDCRNAKLLRERLRSEMALYQFAVDYAFLHFDVLDPWQLTSLELSRKTPFGSLLGRLNYANRFNLHGIQYELDAYPRLGKKMYAYLNFGYSPSAIFPEFRSGAEWFGNLPRGLELSLGMRWLHFPSNVYLYTGSVTKYFGNTYISVRPFFTPSLAGTSRSATVSVRRYLSDADEYITLIFGAGSSPSDVLTPFELERLDSYRIGLEGRKSLSSRLQLKWWAGYEREKLPFDRTRNRFGIGAGLAAPF